MPKYVVLSTLTDHGLRTLKENPGRLTEVNTEISRMGARVLEQWAVLGQYDFVNIIEAPDNATMTRVSVEIGSRGSVRLVTLPAVDAGEFVKSLR
ncbi:MAG TPA: GYD domain-containing protein [Candidatus Methanoperedens sp.]|nr:GYD domain-containing protein [Candidatus Methanoperedens sp.]